MNVPYIKTVACFHVYPVEYKLATWWPCKFYA